MHNSKEKHLKIICDNCGEEIDLNDDINYEVKDDGVDIGNINFDFDYLYSRCEGTVTNISITISCNKCGVSFNLGKDI